MVVVGRGLVVGELFGNYDTVLQFSRKELPLANVPGNKVFGLQLSQDFNHPRDEGLVLSLLHSVDLGLGPIINCDRHKSWDGS